MELVLYSPKSNRVITYNTLFKWLDKGDQSHTVWTGEGEALTALIAYGWIVIGQL